MKKYNKKVLYRREEVIDDNTYEALVLLDKSKEYYNVHIISTPFKDEELNTLDLQEPVKSIDDQDTYFTQDYLLTVIVRYFTWYTFNVDVMCLELKTREY